MYIMYFDLFPWGKESWFRCAKTWDGESCVQGLHCFINEHALANQCRKCADESHTWSGTLFVWCFINDADWLIDWLQLSPGQAGVTQRKAPVLPRNRTGLALFLRVTPPPHTFTLLFVVVEQLTIDKYFSFVSKPLEEGRNKYQTQKWKCAVIISHGRGTAPGHVTSTCLEKMCVLVFVLVYVCVGVCVKNCLNSSFTEHF